VRIGVKTVYLTHPHYYKREELPPTVMAFGYFDGVHRGHQKVIQTAVQIAAEKQLKSAVMTFHPHPSVVLGKKEQHVEYITPLEEKEKLIQQLGVDFLYIVNFDPDFANLLPQQFVDHYIIGLNVQHVVAGFDFTYGRLGKGTMETLPFHSRGMFEQTTVEKFVYDHEKVSSTKIRQLLRAGNVEALPFLLGRFYTIEGTVIDGEKRGRTIGFPTANIEVEKEYIIPPVGVYAVQLFVDGHWHEGVCNIGFKPTFHMKKKDKPTIEVHIFHFQKEIYGQKVIIQWHKRLRDERKFSSVEELINQIKKDKQEAIEYFEKNKNHTCFLF
jgi:riboflavin kinase / FMN adenylyltransferase